MELEWALARHWLLAARIAAADVTNVTHQLPDLDYSFPGPGYIIDMANMPFLSVKYPRGGI